MRIGAALLGLALLASPALADVKAGVDAWNRKEYPRAIAEWRGPANSGDADAQYNLGQAYRRGLGVPLDEKLATDWYRKAADKGHPQAQASLALILFQSSERTEAFPWLEKASAQGEARAQYVLATALFNGDGIAKDWPRAYALMRRASLGGLDPATASLRQMETYLTPADKAQGDTLLRAFAATATTRPPATVARSAAPARSAAGGPSPIAAAPPRPAPRDTEDMKPRWKVQLGAFGKLDAARAHWRALAKRPALAALTPSFTERGGMVRVQAGPLANRAAAQRACAAAEAAGSACFALQP